MLVLRLRVWLRSETMTTLKSAQELSPNVVFAGDEHPDGRALRARPADRSWAGSAPANGDAQGRRRCCQRLNGKARYSNFFCCLCASVAPERGSQWTASTAALFFLRRNSCLVNFSKTRNSDGKTPALICGTPPRRLRLRLRRLRFGPPERAEARHPFAQAQTDRVSLQRRRN